MDSAQKQPQPHPQADPLPIVIIGGGIGGIALAIGLAAQQPPVPFHIYESAPSFGEIGAGITFGANVIRAIHRLSPAMLDAYARHVTANEPAALADAFLTYRRGFREEGGREAGGGGERGEREDKEWIPEKIFNLRGKVYQVGGIQFPARCCVHRAHLLDEWVRLLPPGSATFDKRLVDIVEDEEKGTVLLTFADGATAAASAVVGCDGIKSTTRRYLHGVGDGARDEDAGKGPAAQYAGFFGYRAMAPRAAFERVLGAEMAGTGNLFLCKNGYTIAYPVDHGVALNMFATCVQEETKEGEREGEGEPTWPDDAAWKVPSTEAELRRDLRGWHPGVVDLLVAHGNGEKWAMFHCPHDELYYRPGGGRVCVLGDAAHATTPHLGAGAGMAIEDAFVLSGLLGASWSRSSSSSRVGDHHNNNTCTLRGRGRDLPAVFRAYDAVRRPRSQRVVRESAANVARYCAISSAEGEALARLRGEAHELGGWLWDFDLDRSLAEAIRLMEHDSAGEEPTAKG